VRHAGRVTAASGGDPADPGELAAALEASGYLPDEGLATAAYLALRMHRPLFLEGDAGVGKTSLALALADVFHAELVRLQCYEGIDAAQALYDWDFPRQVLHLRAAEAASDGRLDQAELEHVAAATKRLRDADLLKPPGVAESIDWAQALHLLGARSLDPDRAAATLGAVLKYQEDAVRARNTVLAELFG
jgi:MoxR-like ATPase